VIASWQTIVAATPIAFLLGLGVGWLVSQRWAVVRRADELGENRRATDRGPNGQT
jgi:hypothetical protein